MHTQEQMDALTQAPTLAVASPSYVPTPEDIKWAHEALSLLADDGLMVYPTTKLQYRRDEARKVLTLMNPEQLLERESFVTHMRTIVVFARIGYVVKEKEDAWKSLIQA